MKITKSYLKQIIKEEVDKVKEGRYGSSFKRFGGGSRRESPVETARDSLESAIDQFGQKYYEGRKAELAKEGKGIIPLEKFMGLLEKEKEDWLSSYSTAHGSGGYGDEDEDDRYSSPTEKIMQMPRRLKAVAVMADAFIPHWSVRNNMPDNDY